MCIRDSISLYYYLLVVKAMYISPEEPRIATFRSTCSERASLWVTVLGIILLGIVSYFYDTIFNTVALSDIFGFIA